MASATTVLVLQIPGVVSVVLVQMLSMRILVGVLAGRALSGYSPSLSVLLCSGAGAVVFVVAGRLGSPCAVARHGSKCLGPGVGKTCLDLLTRCKPPLLLPQACSIKRTTAH